MEVLLCECLAFCVAHLVNYCAEFHLFAKLFFSLDVAVCRLCFLAGSNQKVSSELRAIQAFTTTADQTAFNKHRCRRWTKPTLALYKKAIVPQREKLARELPIVHCPVARFAYRDGDSFEFKRLRTLEKLRHW